ncbi:heat shock protein GrpE [Fictibacillus macauensis ZFHKF-1]|uniref:Protein GrpE n=1 Tax=Fictibacillus macauensis ZFHKF-1 TaxID=1196324 RepID=I8AIC7_9BACL|nr:nucleotide exchange factor GrpE [Fictibacillus macauensis]EIT85229.1 heat shock protein GrpE [Fictibacillus macauensis ZFHKF-1]
MEDKQKETVDVELAEEMHPEVEVEDAHAEHEHEENAEVLALQQQVSETENRLLRVQADFENFKRRTREENAAQLKYKSQTLLTQLLPALDNFERALDVQVEDAQAQSVLQGVEMVYRQLMDAVKGEGLEEIATDGQLFDPNKHQAVMQVQEEGYDSNVIVETLQKGYQLNDRVLRPAMVKVNQ